jgi:hypothetical protein
MIDRLEKNGSKVHMFVKRDSEKAGARDTAKQSI